MLFLLTFCTWGRGGGAAGGRVGGVCNHFMMFSQTQTD